MRPASNDSSPTRSQFVVLGLIARYGAMTPYELQARVAESVGFFWPIPPAQLYRDAARLAGLGLLGETAEQAGRRRRIFEITEAGRKSLRDWLADGHTSETQIRDPALLKLAFSDLGSAADLRALAAAQAGVHRHWVQVYSERAASLPAEDPATPSRQRVLELGMAIESAYVTFWAQLAGS